MGAQNVERAYEIHVRDEIQTVRGGERQRPNENAIDYAENGGCGPNAESQGKDGRYGEAGTARQQAQSESGIANQILKNGPNPDRSTFLREPGGVAELLLSGIARARRIHAAGEIVLGLHLQMRAHLLFQIAIEPFAVEKDRQPAAHLAEPSHRHRSPSGRLDHPFDGS